MNKMLILLICVFTFILSSCAPTKQETKKPEKKVIEKKEESIELTLWAWYEGGWEYSITEFQKLFPNVEINVKAFDFGVYQEEYMNALVDGNVPDIMAFDSAHIKNFKDIEGLQDLNQAPFHADKLAKDYPPALWNSGTSVDGKKQFAIPFSTSPRVTFYRPDIMEKYGFPSEPEALANFMEDPNNWFTIAETLAKDGIWLMQRPNELMNLYENQVGFFTKDYKYNRNNETLRKALDLSKRAYQAELVAHFDLYMPEGKQALQEGKIAMIYQGTYGSDEINGFAPEQKGLWRSTRLPFNVYSWNNSSFFSIPGNSNHKEMAWELTGICNNNGDMNVRI